MHAIAVPGEILGYFEAKEKFGNPEVPMEDIMQPTITLCKNGIKVTRTLSGAIAKMAKFIFEDAGLR